MKGVEAKKRRSEEAKKRRSEEAKKRRSEEEGFNFYKHKQEEYVIPDKNNG